jgi:hypothetical protein
VKGGKDQKEENLHNQANPFISLTIQFKPHQKSKVLERETQREREYYILYNMLLLNNIKKKEENCLSKATTDGKVGTEQNRTTRQEESTS